MNHSSPKCDIVEYKAAKMNRSVSFWDASEVTLKIKDFWALTEHMSNPFIRFKSGVNKWCLFVYSKNKNLDVYLRNENADADVRTCIFLSIIDSDGLKRFITAESHHFKSKNDCKFPEVIKTEQLRDDPKVTPGGELRLHCEIANLEKIAENLQFRIPVSDDETDLVTFLPKHENLSDVTIAIGEKEIKAHKVILAMQSPVFAAMFASEMLEQQQNRIVIADMDYEVVQQMLCYVYTGRTSKLTEMADQLLMAADKYSLDELKMMCQQELCSTISMDTVTHLMGLAGLYNANLLKKKLNEFIKNNFMKLMDKESWLELLYDVSCKKILKNEP